MSGPTSRSLQELSRALEAAQAGPVAWSGPPGAWHQKAVGNPYPQLGQLAHSCESNLELLSSALGWFSSFSSDDTGPLVVVLDEPLRGPLLERLESVSGRGENLLLLWLDLGRRYSAAPQSWLRFGQDTRSSLDGGLLAPLGIEFLGTAELNKPERLLRTLEQALAKTGSRLLHLLGPEPAATVQSALRSNSFALSEGRRQPAPSTPFQRSATPPLAEETLEVAVLERLLQEFRDDPQLRVFWALGQRSPGSLRALGDRLRRIDLTSVLAEARGASAAGLYPVVAISADGLPTLLPHLLGGLRHPITLLVLGGGLSFDEGDTFLHPGRLRDLGLLRLVNGLAVAVPADLEEAVQMYRLGRTTETPVAIRLSSVPAIGIKTQQSSLLPGKAHCLRGAGRPVSLALLALGSTVFPSLLAAEALSSWGVDCSVYDMRFIKPFDLEILEQLGPRLLCVEEHCLQGGLNTCVLEARQLLDLPPIPVHALGLPFHPPIPVGSSLEQFDLHAEGIQRKARLCLGMDRRME